MAIMFLTGAGLALVLDLIGITLGHLDAAARTRPGHRRPRSGIWDLALWLLVTPLVCGAILISSRGEMRVYVFAGLGLGLIAYTLLARGLVMAAGVASRRAVVRAGGLAVRKVAAPVSAAGRRASWVAGWAGRWTRERGRALGRLARAALAGFGRKAKE